MRFQVNDIVTSGPGWRPGVFVIIDIHPSRPKNPYDGVSLVNGKTFRMGDDSLASKRIGVADQGWNALTVKTDGDVTSTVIDHNFLKGQLRAQHEIAILQFPGNGSEADRKRWEKLASLKPGDTFTCNVRGKVDTMTFRYVADRGYKFVFVAENDSGKRYKYPLSVVVV